MSNSILIDFDGTIVEHIWPEIGRPLPGAFETMRDLKLAGYNLVLWTCREDELLAQAVDFCREHGVEFDAINEVMPEDNIGSRKPYCKYFIDDKNLGGFPGWDWVRRLLLPSWFHGQPSSGIRGVVPSVLDVFKPT